MEIYIVDTFFFFAFLQQNLSSNNIFYTLAHLRFFLNFFKIECNVILICLCVCVCVVFLMLMLYARFRDEEWWKKKNCNFFFRCSCCCCYFFLSLSFLLFNYFIAKCIMIFSSCSASFPVISCLFAELNHWISKMSHNNRD